MALYHDMTEMIGGTPLLALERLGQERGWQAKVLAKLEYFNPAGSVKDRAALGMIRAAEKEGRLRPGSVIVEPTSGNTGIGLAAIAAEKAQIADKPLLAGVIGPFSLAGRLMDVSEILYACVDEPETVHLVVEKAAQFVTSYIQALREAGADGVVMAEPLAGVLSPAMMEEFSCGAVQAVISAVQRADFPVVYHNCGRLAPAAYPMLADLGAAAYHFGNAIQMADALAAMPRDVLVMGNVDPAGVLTSGTPARVREATLALMAACGKAENFLPSTGCDVPYAAPWENIEAFFAAVEEAQA